MFATPLVTTAPRWFRSTNSEYSIPDPKVPEAVITGIDLDGERRGILPSTEWKRNAYKKPSQQRWYAGETVSVAVGQGYNSFTLLQLAQATAVLANDGVYMRPHLVEEIHWPRTGEVEKPVTEPSHVIPLKPENLAIVRNAMVDVIRKGTARRVFQGAHYQAAGKTGTAQVFSLRGARYDASAVDERLRDHSLFMAYAPMEDPQIAVALIVENGGWGSTVAAAIARKVFDFWLAPERVEARRAASAATYQPALTHETGEEEAGGESPDAVVPPEQLPPAAPEDDAPAPVAPAAPQPTLRIQLRSVE